MKELLDDPRYDVKVVHLVRDPRGSLYSMAKLHLHKLMPEYHCPLIYDDLVNGPKFMAEYPGRVISVTYEQFCLDPVGQSGSLLPCVQACVSLSCSLVRIASGYACPWPRYESSIFFYVFIYIFSLGIGSVTNTVLYGALTAIYGLL